MGTVYPATYMRGSRETFGLYPNEPNFPRFTLWLGQNSSSGKQRRLLGELHTRMLSSGVIECDRCTCCAVLVCMRASERVRVCVWRLIFVPGAALHGGQPAGREPSSREISGHVLQPAATDRSSCPCLDLPAAGPGCACPTCQCCATPSPARCSPRWATAL